MGVQNYGEDAIRSEDDIAKVFRTFDISVVDPSWQEVYSGSPGSIHADLLGELGGFLYISTAGGNGIVIMGSTTGNPQSWVQVNTNEMNGYKDNSQTYNDSSVFIDGYLYIAVNNDIGFEVWRSAGIPTGNGAQVDWEKFGTSGWSDTNNIHASLIDFNGLLYAWTTNYVSGQQVRRADSLILFHTYLPQIAKDEK